MLVFLHKLRFIRLLPFRASGINLEQVIKGGDTTAFVFIILQHFINFPLIVAGDAIRQDGNFVSRLTHIEVGGFHTGDGSVNGADNLL